MFLDKIISKKLFKEFTKQIASEKNKTKFRIKKNKIVKTKKY